MHGTAIIKEWESQKPDNVYDIHVNMDAVAFVEDLPNMKDVFLATFICGKSMYIDAHTYDQMARWIDERHPNREE